MEQRERVPWYGYLALILTILFLSGIFSGSEGPLAALDFTNTLGQFGDLGVVHDEGAVTLARDFRGMGGFGVRDGFAIVLQIAPAICLAFGVIELFNHYKGLEAAQKILTPIMKPLLNLPGASTVAFVANLISPDAGAALTNSFYEEGAISLNQNLIMTSFMFSAPAILVNYFALGSPIFPLLPVSMSVLLGIIIVMKFVGAFISRFLFAKFQD